MAKADEDLAAASVLLEHEHLAEVTAFHAQQAAEKALKAYLSWRDEPFRRTHDLTELVTQCEALDPAFARLRDGARSLSPYATEVRYPGEIGSSVSSSEAAAAKQMAESVVAFVSQMIWPIRRP